MVIYRIMDETVPGFRHFGTKKEVNEAIRKIKKYYNDENEEYGVEAKAVTIDIEIEKVVIKTKADLIAELNRAAQTDI